MEISVDASMPGAQDRADRATSPHWRFMLTFAVVIALLFARALQRFFDLDEHQFVAPAILIPAMPPVRLRMTASPRN